MKTVRFFLVTFLMFSFAQNVFSQNFGIRAGANLSTASRGNFPEVRNNNGYYAGIYREVGIIPSMLFVQPEIQFSKQGFSTITSDFDLNYIQVPVLAKLYLMKIISIESGPQFGFKVSDKIRGPLNPDFRDFDTAWAVGMSLNLPFGLSINGRYIGSFKEVARFTNSENQVIQVGAALTF